MTDLFPAPKRPRRKLMRVVDGGEIGWHLVCPRCDHDDGWHDVSWRTARRMPCPKCNTSEVVHDSFPEVPRA